MSAVILNIHNVFNIQTAKRPLFLKNYLAAVLAIGHGMMFSRQTYSDSQAGMFFEILISYFLLD